MNKLKERRLELGLTQPELSRIIRAADPRIDVSMISRFECGACLPTPRVLEALESALQADRRDLFGEEELAALDAIGAVEEVKEAPEEVMAVVAQIPYGRENAISREALGFVTGLSDRVLRKQIEQARRCGYVICNSQDGKGYFWTDDLDDMERQYRQITNRAFSMLVTRKPLRARLKAAGREV